MSIQLTDVFVRQSKPAAGVAHAVEIADSIIVGLYLVVHPSGFRSWAYRYRAPDGRTRKFTIRGGYPAVSLAAARKAAEGLRKRVALGEDPARARGCGRKLILIRDRSGARRYRNSDGDLLLHIIDNIAGGDGQ